MPSQTKELNKWIAQSESWELFKSLHLPDKYMASYQFLERYDDFYVYLIGELFQLLREENTGFDSDDYLRIAKGLEIFSLKHTSNNFLGVDKDRNLIYAAALYYLAGYSASSLLIMGALEVDLTQLNPSQELLVAFLSRDLNISNNEYVELFSNFIHGHEEGLETLVESLKKDIQNSKNTPAYYVSAKLALHIVEKFSNSNVRDILKNYNQNDSSIWSDYISKNLHSRKPPIWEFFPSQIEAIKKGVLTNPITSIQMPTSAGKTAICELVIYQHIKSKDGNKVLFLAPFRALALELKSGFGFRLGNMGIKTKTLYGSDSPSPIEIKNMRDVDVLIATPEKYKAVQSLDPELNNLFNLVICDEGHLLDEYTRGLSYELLLTKLKLKNIPDFTTRFLFLSAIIPNIDSLNTWLGGNTGSVVRSNYKPTQVEYAFLDDYVKGKANLEVNPLEPFPKRYIINSFISEQDAQYVNPKSSKLNHYSFASIKSKSVVAALKSLHLGSVALFTTSKGSKGGGVSALARETIKQLDLLDNIVKPEAYMVTDKVLEIAEYFTYLFGQKFFVTQALLKGIGCHYGDLPQCAREEIEHAVRNRVIPYVICTSTLAEGVNLPIRTMVAYSLRRYTGNKRRPYRSLLVRDIKNITGRVGRAGKETSGLVIIANKKDFPLVQRLLKGDEEEPVYGYLYDLVTSIHEEIKKERLVLNDDTFEELSERIKQIIDEIDISLIELLGEEVQSDSLEQTILKIIDATYAAQETDEEVHMVLRNVFTIRGKKIMSYKKEGTLDDIKASLTSPRLFFLLNEKVKESIDLWADESSNWTTLMELSFDILTELPQVEYLLSSFNKVNKATVEMSTLNSIVKLWLEGATYVEISRITSIEINLLLKIFHNVVEYHFLLLISSICNVAERSLTTQEMNVPEELVNFAQYVRYGVNNRTQLSIVSFGFTDRSTVLEIEDYLRINNIQYENYYDLKDAIIYHAQSILQHIDNTLPSVCTTKARNTINLLEQPNIY